jgi:hypothetical protein
LVTRADRVALFGVLAARQGKRGCKAARADFVCNALQCWSLLWKYAELKNELARKLLICKGFRVGS